MALISCSQCGKPISDTAKICPHCGLDVSAEKRKRENEREYSHMPEEKQKALRREYDSRYRDYATFEAKIKRRKIIGYVAIALAVLLMAFMVLVALQFAKHMIESEAALDYYNEAVNSYNSVADRYYAIENNYYATESDRAKLGEYRERMNYWDSEIEARSEEHDTIARQAIAWGVAGMALVLLEMIALFTPCFILIPLMGRKYVVKRLRYLKHFQHWLEQEKKIGYHFVLTERERRILEEIS